MDVSSAKPGSVGQNGVDTPCSLCHTTHSSAETTPGSAGLFGLGVSNKNFAHKRNWGKNTATNSLPTSILLYMEAHSIPPYYLHTTAGGAMVCDTTSLTWETLFGCGVGKRKYFFEHVVSGSETKDSSAQNSDLVVCGTETMVGLEMKLCTFPDQSTKHLSGTAQGAELVVRVGTLTQASLVLHQMIVDNGLEKTFRTHFANVAPLLDTDDHGLDVARAEVVDGLRNFLNATWAYQQPLVVQPLWKTLNNKLEENCFDAVVWSTHALLEALLDKLDTCRGGGGWTRLYRSVVIVCKSLTTLMEKGQIDSKTLIATASKSFPCQTDKGFALPGTYTSQWLGKVGAAPRLKKYVLRDIFLNENRDYMQPERRLDGYILTEWDDLFEPETVKHFDIPAGQHVLSGRTTPGPVRKFVLSLLGYTYIDGAADAVINK